MFYEFVLTVPAGTQEDEPEELECWMDYGIITLAEVSFPPGCRRYVYVCIDDKLHQVWPTNPEGAFRSDNWTIRFTARHPLLEPPYMLKLRGWSPDANHDHDITARFEVLSPEDAYPFQESVGLLAKLKALFGLK
jgi:hypothetical protein